MSRSFITSVPGLAQRRLRFTSLSRAQRHRYSSNPGVPILLPTVAVWPALAASTAGGEVFHQDGVLISSAGGKWPVMNTAFLSTSVATEAELQHRISIARRYFGEKKRSWLFIVCNEWLDSCIHPQQVFWSSGLSHMQLASACTQGISQSRRVYLQNWRFASSKTMPNA